MLPLIAMCDRWDIGGLSTNAHPQTGGPTIFIHEGHPGGVGITRRGYDQFERLVGDAQRLIGECPCRDGCPSCVQSPKCGNLNEPLSKAGALELLARMCAARYRPRPGDNTFSTTGPAAQNGASPSAHSHAAAPRAARVLEPAPAPTPGSQRPRAADPAVPGADTPVPTPAPRTSPLSARAR